MLRLSRRFPAPRIYQDRNINIPAPKLLSPISIKGYSTNNNPHDNCLSTGGKIKCRQSESYNIDKDRTNYRSNNCPFSTKQTGSTDNHCAITFSSLPSPRMGFPPELRAAYAKPARDAVNPQKVNARILIKSVLTPEKRAAASLPPVSENSKSVLRRISGSF